MIPDKECYLAAYDELRKTYSENTDEWFKTVEMRFDFVSEAGLNKDGNPKYEVELTEKLGDESKFDAYVVVVNNLVVNGKPKREGFWCQCRVVSPYGGWLASQPCTHIGAVVLFRLYEKHLREKKDEELSLAPHFAI
jgi:hypothetical protein